MTKRERCKIYRQMLDSILTERLSWNKRHWKYDGFCHYIQRNIGGRMGMFPELMLQEPKRPYSSYWWIAGARPGRIKALKAAIELCKPNKK